LEIIRKDGFRITDRVLRYVARKKRWDTADELQEFLNDLNRQSAGKPRAIQLRAEVLRQWCNCDDQDMPIHERTTHIANKLGESRSTINYHVNQLGLRPAKKTKKIKI
jgi:hypothetical protein